MRRCYQDAHAAPRALTYVRGHSAHPLPREGPTSSAGYYELKRSGLQFMFNLRAGSNEIIPTSELHAFKAGAEGGIASAPRNSPIDAPCERKVSKKNQPFFVQG